MVFDPSVDHSSHPPPSDEALPAAFNKLENTIDCHLIPTPTNIPFIPKRIIYIYS